MNNSENTIVIFVFNKWSLPFQEFERNGYISSKINER